MAYLSSFLDSVKCLTNFFTKQFTDLDPYLFFIAGNLEIAYKESLDGGGRTFGQEYFRLFHNINFTPSGSVLEWCCGPGFIGFGIMSKFKIHKLVLHDINPAVANVVKETIRKNKLQNVKLYCSQSITGIPAQTFNLIVANPPHFSSRNFYANPNVQDQIIYDFGWEAHRLFFENISNYMNNDSLLILQENNRGSVTEDFRKVIEQSNLKLIESVGDKGFLTSSDNFYFLLIKKGTFKEY